MPHETEKPAEISDPHALLEAIRSWAKELGFQQLGVSDVELGEHRQRFLEWLQNDYHGGMTFMHKHGSKRYQPAELVPHTRRVISVRMDYFPPDATDADEVLQTPGLGYVSRYALGRDYHKLMRKRLQKLADRINARTGPFGYRVFVDSAPVLEKPLAEKAGLGWIGKHTNLINQDAGSWFFLGEIYTDLPLPLDTPDSSSHCGSCRACIDICPTDAIIAPYQLDARRCISYLTIELDGPIPVEYRAAMGNRIYGCDDCQLVCPWNRFATPSVEKDFHTRHPLDAAGLLELFSWDKKTFLASTEGSAIRRIGYERWLRNIAVAMGNAPRDEAIIRALEKRKTQVDAVVAEHIEWALTRQRATAAS